MGRKIEPFFIAGPAGRLEAILEEPEGGPAREAALVCHPHPLHGGTMHNKVAHRLARGLRKAGAATLRFNFRGVNLSQGTHDKGTGEVEDARTALRFLQARFPGLPLTLAGFSFGSAIALTLAADLGAEGPWRTVAAGYPALNRRQEFPSHMDRLRVFIQSTNDEYGPREELEALYERLWGPKALYWIEARDHFFTGGLEEFERVVTGLGCRAS